MKNIISKWNSVSIIKKIIVGLILGVILGVAFPDSIKPVTVLGSLFVGALKGIAPILVLFLVIDAIAQHKEGTKTNINSILFLYLLGTFLGGFVAVVASFIFPVKIALTSTVENMTAPGGVGEVIHSLLMSVVENPVKALVNANYIGILSWAIIIGLAIRKSSNETKTMISDISLALSKMVGWIIEFAPFGIMGLVFDAIVTNGLSSFTSYGELILLLVGCMLFVALVVNPLIVFIALRKNPYPLVFKCLKDSGITAFFTRSSAANIPVNMSICEELNLDKDTYSVSIPLGATINMAGASVTISILTLAAAHTLNIPVDIPTALILSLLSTVCACGTSGVSGGSLLLIPLACSLFGIPSDIAMEVVGVGFIIGVIQDSCETAINSSTDVLFTATADFAKRRKNSKNKTK